MLRKEVKGKQVLPNNEGEGDVELFQMGRDKDFEGSRPDREVGEQELAPTATKKDVLFEPHFTTNGKIQKGRKARGNSQGGTRGKHGGCGGPYRPPVEKLERKFTQ
jgi:hypothetical protein